MLEKCRRPTLSGCSSATCSMSMPPMAEKMITGCLRDAVPDDAGVVLLLDLGLRVDQHAARHVAVDLELEDVLGVGGGLVGRVGELHAAGLHAAAGQDLGLDDGRAADLLGDRAGLLGVLAKPNLVTGMPARLTISRASYSKKRMGRGTVSGGG